MKIKRFLIAICLLSLLLCSAVFTACKGKFDEVDFVVSTVKEINGTSFACDFKAKQEGSTFNTNGYLKLYMGAGEDGKLKHLTFEDSKGGNCSEAYFKIEIKNVPEEFSKGFSYINSNAGVVSVLTDSATDSNLSSKGSTHIIKLSASSGGESIITFYPNAGGKNKSYTLTVDVICELTDMKLNSSYNPYVVAGNLLNDGTFEGGESLILSENQAFTFTPHVSTQKDVDYTFQTIQGTEVSQDGKTLLFKGSETVLAEIKGKELFVYETYENNEITIKAYNTKATQLAQREFYLNVKVIHKIKESEINLLVNQEPIKEVVLSNNIFSEMQKTVTVNFDFIDSNATIEFLSSNESVFLVEKTTIVKNGNSFNFLISSNNIGEANLIVKVSYLELNYSYEILREITVENFVQNLNVKGNFNTKLYLYSSYSGTKLSGESIEVITTPINSLDNRFLIYMSPENLNYISLKAGSSGINVITNKNELIYNNIDNKYLYNSNTLINLKSIATKNTNIDIYFISYHSLSYSNYQTVGDLENTVCYKLNIDLKQGVQKGDVKFDGFQLDNLYLVKKGASTQIQFSYSSVSHSEFIDVSFLDIKIARAETSRIYLEDKVTIVGGRKFAEFNIEGLWQGDTKVILTFANGVQVEAYIKCFIEPDGFILNSNKTANNSSVVGKIEYNSENSISKLYMANTGEKLSVFASLYYLEGSIKVYSNIEYNNIYFNSQKNNIAEINEIGTITAKGIGTTVVTVTVEHYTEYGLDTITKSFVIQVYTPLSSVEILEKDSEKTITNKVLYKTENYFYYSNYSQTNIVLKIYPTDLDGIEVFVNNMGSDIFNIVAVSEYNYKISVKESTNNIGVRNIVFTVKQFDRSYTTYLTLELKRIEKIGSIYSDVNEIYKTYEQHESSPIEDFRLQNININENATFKDLLYVFIPENSADKDDVEFEIINNNDENIQNDIYTGVFISKKAVNGRIYAISKDIFVYNKDTEYSTAEKITELITKITTASTKNAFETELKKALSLIDEDNLIYTENVYYIKATLEVADGTTNYPYLIRNALELKNMDLTKHYLLKNDIDLFSYSWQPLGLKENGEIQELTGSLNGEYNRFGESYQYSIAGLNLTSTIINPEDVNLKNTSYYQGLFAKISNSGVVKNLNLIVNKINVNINLGQPEVSNKNIIYLGSLTAINEGFINNVSVQILNSDIKLKHISAIIGGVVGLNRSSAIKNAKSSGFINVSNVLNLLDGDNIYLGGLIGENIADLDLEFRLFSSTNNKIFEDNYNSSVQINTELDEGHNQPCHVGGAIGYTKGKIKGILTSSKITSNCTNVGGVVGCAEAEIDYCFASGETHGKNNVGGIVGKSDSNITNCTMFIFDKNGEINETTPNIKGHENVGGIVGDLYSTNELNFIANYIRSYYSGENESCFDIVAESKNVGGLIGSSNKVTIERSYAYLNKINLNTQNGLNSKTIGALLGVSTSSASINYVFFRGKLFNNINELTGDDLKLVGNVTVNPVDKTWYINNDTGITDNGNYTVNNDGSVTINSDDIYWVKDENYNDGYLITINDENKIMSIEAPISITSNIIGDNDADDDEIDDVNSYTKNTTQSNKTYYKVVDSTGNQYALLYYYKNNARNNTILLSEIVNITINPSTAVTQFLEYKTSNASVVKISGSHIILMGSGEVTITVTSKLNKSVNATINLVVIDALTTFEVYTNQSLTQQLKPSTNIMLNSKQELYIKCDSDKVLYKLNSNNTHINLLNGKDLELEYKPINYYEYSLQDKILLEFIKEINATQITVTPIYYVSGVMVELQEEKAFTYNIFKGLIDASLDNTHSEIYLDEIASIVVNTQTHEDVTAEIDAEIITATQKDENDNEVNIRVEELDGLIKINVVENNILIGADYLKHQDLLTREIINNKDLFITIKVIITTTHNGVSVEKEILYTLTLHNQKLYNISSKYYGYNQLISDLYGNTVININEVETDKIVAGEWGLLDIELFPHYADIEKIEFSYSSNNNEPLSARQLALNPENNRYYTLGATGVIEGDYTTLNQNQVLVIKKASTIDLTNNNTEYNGHLYLSLLVKTNALTTTTYTLKLKVYSSDNVYKEYIRTLGTTISTNISISYNGSNEYGVLVYQNTINDKIVNNLGEQTNQTLVVNIQDIQLESNYSNLYFVIDGNVVSALNGSWTYSGLSNNNKEFTINLKVASKYSSSINSNQLIINISSTLPIGDKITISYKAQTVINQKQVYVSSNNIVLVGSLYFVYSNNIDGVQNGIFSKAIHSSYFLKANLLARFSQTFGVEAKRQLKELEIEITEIAYNTNKYFYGVDTQSVTPTELSTTKSYNSYKIISDSFLHNSQYKKRILITPKQIYFGDIIIFAVKIKYGTNISLETYDHKRETVMMQEGENVYQALKQTFTLDFFFNATEEQHAQPISDVSGLKNMKPNGYYRLTQDIVITERWTPLDIDFKYLDGNGYSIILVNGFNIKSSQSEENGEAESESVGNYGLFAKIYEQSLVLNLTVSITSTQKFERVGGNYISSENGKDFFNPDGEEYIGYTVTTNNFDENLITYNFTSSLANNLNIGLLAGVNDGTVYNSFATIGSNTVLKYNLNNSLDVGSVQIGGLVGENNGFISYTKSNTSIYVEEASSTIGGLVATNNGLISACSFTGYTGVLRAINYSTSARNEEYAAVAGLVAINTKEGKIYESSAKDATIYSSVKASSFVCINEGLISNCYANLDTSANLTVTGFVCTNSGTILSCYSASEIERNAEKVSPFLNENTGKVQDCYYIKSAGDGLSDDSFASMLQNGSLNKEQFKEFLFATDRNGVWVLETNETPTLVEENYIANLKTNKGQNNSDTFTSWSVLDSEINENEEVYNWAKQGSGHDGDENNPIVIYSEENFNSAFSNKAVDYNYVVINDIEFNEGNTTSTLREFKGAFYGNNMTFNNLNLNASSYKQAYFGLFGEITNATVKNLNLNFAEVFANSSNVVGGLAGKIENSHILNITIGGENTVIQGINLVGGLAGLIIDSCVTNINVSVSINASYSGGEQFMYTLNLNKEELDKNVKNLKSSYAGAVAGAVLGKFTDVNKKTQITNVSVYGNSRVIAYTGATGFGYLGQNVTLNYAKVLIVPTQFVYTSFVGGGLVGENHGTIINSYIEYQNPELMLELDTYLGDISGYEKLDIDERDLNFFKNRPLVIGGLVGVNFSNNTESETIQNCYSKIDVRNLKTVVAGGLVGITVQGTIKNCYATGSVLSKDVVGGLIGSVTTLKIVVATVKDGKEQIGSGIYPASDLYVGNVASGYDNTKVNGTSKFTNYVVSEDSLTDEVGAIERDYAATINNNMALNNYYKNGEIYDYTKAQFFGTFIGSIYGVFDGSITSILDSAEVTLSNNFSYNIKKSATEDYLMIATVSDMLNGDEVARDSFKNSLGEDNNNVYLLDGVTTDTDTEKTEVYAIYNSADNFEAEEPEYFYIKQSSRANVDEAWTVDAEYVYIKTESKMYKVNGEELIELTGCSASITLSVDNKTNDTLTLEITGTAINLSAKPITNLKNGGYSEGALQTASDVITQNATTAIDNKFTSIITKEINDKIESKISSKIYAKESELQIFNSPEIQILVNLEGENLTSVVFNIDYNIDTDTFAHTYTYDFSSNPWNSENATYIVGVIIGALNEVLDLNYLSQEEINKYFETHKNKALSFIYNECNISNDDGEYNIDKAELPEKLKPRGEFINNYLLISTENEGEYTKEITLSKELLISPNLSDRINTADLFKEVFGENFNTYVDGVTTIFPKIEINLNKPTEES